MKNVLSSMPDILTAQLLSGNNYPGNSHAVIPVAQLGMDVKEIRLIRLRQLISENYDGYSGKFADAHGLKRPQVSRWITTNPNARQGVSEESAREIEAKEKKPPYWMDRLDDSSEGPTMAPLVAKVFALPCVVCGHVSHQSFIDLEMNDTIACPSCKTAIEVASYYGQAELAEFLKSIGGSGFVLRKR